MPFTFSAAVLEGPFSDASTPFAVATRAISSTSSSPSSSTTSTNSSFAPFSAATASAAAAGATAAVTAEAAGAAEAVFAATPLLCSRPFLTKQPRRLPPAVSVRIATATAWAGESSSSSQSVTTVGRDDDAAGRFLTEADFLVFLEDLEGAEADFLGFLEGSEGLLTTSSPSFASTILPSAFVVFFFLGVFFSASKLPAASSAAAMGFSLGLAAGFSEALAAGRSGDLDDPSPAGVFFDSFLDDALIAFVDVALLPPPLDLTTLSFLPFRAEGSALPKKECRVFEGFLDDDASATPSRFSLMALSSSPGVSTTTTDEAAFGSLLGGGGVAGPSPSPLLNDLDLTSPPPALPDDDAGLRVGRGVTIFALLGGMGLT
mmetsp:Transcript_34893/g.74428  ORF Transcript_34893/g.74428 Transcript_34893/m.74428 type:complete len:375 (+) Transcript_34893:4224-5348(+)